MLAIMIFVFVRPAATVGYRAIDHFWYLYIFGISEKWAISWAINYWNLRPSIEKNSKIQFGRLVHRLLDNYVFCARMGYCLLDNYAFCATMGYRLLDQCFTVAKLVYVYIDQKFIKFRLAKWAISDIDHCWPFDKKRLTVVRP